MGFSPKRYLINLWITTDQVINSVIFLGAPDETLSSRMGRIKDGPKNTLGRRISRAACWLLNKIDPGHCDRVEERESSIIHREESLHDKPGD